MNLDARKYVIFVIIGLTVLIFLGRLIQLQIIDESWQVKAAEMTERKITICEVLFSNPKAPKTTYEGRNF